MIVAEHKCCKAHGFWVSLRNLSYWKFGLGKRRGINRIPELTNCREYVLHQMLGALQSVSLCALYLMFGYPTINQHFL